MEAIRRLTAGLSHPIQRVGFVILVVGAVLTIIGLTQLGTSVRSYPWFEHFIAELADSLTFDRYNYRRFPLASVGPYVLILGLLLSFLYESTVGRLLIWIRHG